MKTISQVLSDRSRTQNFQNTRRVGNPAGVRRSGTDERPKAEELERIWRSVPIAFAAVNKTVQFIMSKEWSIEGPNAEEFRTFLDNIGEVGGDMHWDAMLERIFRDQAIYGECFIENIFTESENELVDLALLDAKEMKYAEDGHGNIAVDDFGNPIGYFQDFEDGVLMRDQIYEPPKQVSTDRGEIFFPHKNVAHFKMYTVGEGFYPVGLLEPVFRSAERFYQLQEDYGNKAHSSLFPMRAAKVGDEMHEPSPQRIQEIQQNLRNASSSTEIALPYYIDIEMLEAENPESLIEFFKHFSDDIIAGVGMPRAFATGTGENVNRATLNAQTRMLNLSIRDIVNRTARTIEKEIFRVKAEQEGMDGYPEIVWDLDGEPVSGDEGNEDEGTDDDDDMNEDRE